MNDDYGLRIGTALHAIHQMHLDVSRLLLDCDGTVGKNKQPATKPPNATKGLSYSLGKPWIAWGVFRCYAVSAEQPGLVDALNVWFYDLHNRIDEPHLMVARMQMQLREGQVIQDVCEGFEPLLLAAEAVDESRITPRAIIRGGPSEAGWGCGPVEWIRVLGVPLYSVTKLSDVEDLMRLVQVES